MKRIKILMTAALLGLLIAGCEREPINEQTLQTPAAGLKSAVPSSGFHISGTRLLDANGNDFVMRGINYAHTSDAKKYPYGIPAIAATGANTIRIVITNATKLSELIAIIGMCEKYKLIMVLENHDATFLSDLKIFNDIIQHWIDLKGCFINKADKIIINIANEPSFSGSNFSTRYIDAITKLRGAGIQNTLMIDANGGKYVEYSIGSNGKAILDYDDNTLFSIHVYDPIGKTDTLQKTMDYMRDLNFPFCVGEFSWTTSSSTTDDVDEELLMSLCEERKIGWIAWSWAKNGSTSIFMDMDKSGNCDGSMLTDWGNTVISGPNGLSTTSTICSVYNTLYLKEVNLQNYGPLQIDINAVYDYAAYAKSMAVIGDGVKLFNMDATMYSSLGGGDPDYNGVQDGLLSLGVWVCVHNIVSGFNKGVELRDPGSQISGDVISRGIIKGKPIVDATKKVTFPGTLYPNLGEDFAGYLQFKNYDRNRFYTNSKNPYKFNAANSVTDLPPIEPGIYGEFNIGSRNNVQFKAGTYYFSSFIVEPDVNLYFPSLEKVVIFVKGEINIKSRTRMFTPQGKDLYGANPLNILMVSGAQANKAKVNISPQVSWRGTLIAPEAEINIGSNTEGNTDGTLSLDPNSLKYRKWHNDGEMYGAVIGKYVCIHQRTSLYHVPFDWYGLAPF